MRVDLECRDDSEWVSDMFAMRVQHWTPTPASHAVCLLYAPVSRDPQVSNYCASVLSDTELHRADRFVTDNERSNFIQRRAFRRYCGSLALGSRPLSQIVFKQTKKGRPYLPDQPRLWFSFSACKFGFLGAWSSTHGVGVDIEDKERDLEPVDLARQFFSEAEARAVEEVDGLARQRTFLQLWCLKEAALKSLGEGLPMGLDAFEFALAPDLRVLRFPPNRDESEQFDPYLLEGPKVCAALVLRRAT